MKGLFPHYADASSLDHASIWKEAIFVFDTNVLLNLYRYRPATRNELLEVLGKLAQRIWVPHHVALEFQRNRLKVIADQNKRFSDVRKVVQTAQSNLLNELNKLQLPKRHSLISTQQLTAGLDQLVSEFVSELDKLQETQQKVTGPDPLKDRIETLFEGRVGPAPKDQEEIDNLYKVADARFKLRIPPGYLDKDKDKDDLDEYQDAGFMYKRRFGDYVVWQQLLAHTKVIKTTSVIFVTDDGKDDWWQKIDSGAPKTIGPRPELVDEARRVGEVTSLLMYSPENFLKYAKQFLQAQISEATLTEVRDISAVSVTQGPSEIVYQGDVIRIKETVLAWLRMMLGDVGPNLIDNYPELMATIGGQIYGIQIVAIQNALAATAGIVSNALHEAQARLLKSPTYSEIDIIFVTNGPLISKIVLDQLDAFASSSMPSKIRVIVGSVMVSSSGDRYFKVHDSRLAPDL